MKYNEQEKSRDTYRTGSTNPPKSYQGTVAVLLILVTVLSSIVTVLGMMNIRLWNILESRKIQDSALAGEDQIALAEVCGEPIPIEEGIGVWGMTCQDISELYRSYNGWPSGLYIAQVEPDSIAQKGNILAGDILVAVNGKAVVFREELEQAAQDTAPGTQLTLTVYRDDTQLELIITVD